MTNSSESALIPCELPRAPGGNKADTISLDLSLTEDPSSAADLRKPILVFDVNETLLDLSSLEPHFTRMFDDPSVMREWFNLVILYSQAATLSQVYANFGQLGGAVLRMLAEIKGVSVHSDDLVKVKEAVAAMPACDDVAEGLHKLRAAGFRMVTLTNNPRETCDEQLKHAGIRDYFEHLFSIDEGTRRYKPAQEAYHMVADSLGVTSSELCLVACHTWDTMGAAAAGWKTALLVRTGNAPLEIGRQPDVTGLDLRVVADALIVRF